MRLGEDDRGRVPFAVVGVLLVVTSAAYTASMSSTPEASLDRSVGQAVERATASSQSVIRTAVTRAGRDAAREPVLDPANTSFGRVLNESATFRDYLRVRVYHAARTSLPTATARVGAVTATASLPATPNASALRRAKRRVAVEPAASNESAGIRVRIENVTVTARRGGRVVERTTVDASLVVATPALALHDRTERFESRLNRGVARPGLGQRLTARLYPVAWTRGYAQYAGTPIENVLANRHVELAANGALLREQRAAFGRSDPAGRRGVAWAAAQVGATDFLMGTDISGKSWGRLLIDRVQSGGRGDPPMPGGPAGSEAAAASPSPDANVSVGVNATADSAFRDAFAGGEDGDGARPIRAVLDAAYEADLAVTGSVERRRNGRRPSPTPPGRNWTLASEDTRTSVRTRPATGGGRARRPSGPGWSRLRTDSRRVVREHAVVRRWTRGNRTRRTVGRWTDTFSVTVAVFGRPSPGVDAPRRGVFPAFERGGPLDGPNLRDVRRTAADRLVARHGGADGLARRAVSGRLDIDATVRGRQPDRLTAWVYRDLAALRDRLRNVSVSVSRGAVGSGRANPAAALAELLEQRRERLVGAPETYDGVATRARVAVRAAYVDRVLERLRARAGAAAKTQSGLRSALEDAGVSLESVRESLAARTEPAAPHREPLRAAGPGRNTSLRVDGDPAYLTLTGLDHRQVRAVPQGETVHPLAARTTNVFTVPYGDAADTVVDALPMGRGVEETDLRTAATVLRATNQTLAERQNETLARRYAVLRRQVEASLRRVRRRAATALDGERLGLSPSERRAVVRRGLARWNGTAARAFAVANGSAGAAVARAVRARTRTLRTPTGRDWTRLRVRLALDRARREVGPVRQTAVEDAGETATHIAEGTVKTMLANELGTASEAVRKRWAGSVLGSIPAGLPVTPVPGYWYATMNVWEVSVRGGYERFAVRASQGSPTAGGGTVSYVREAGTVALDADGDGDPERLGATTPVSFETGTTVAVVVPPGGKGVGDTDGDADERSPGWAE